MYGDVQFTRSAARTPKPRCIPAPRGLSPSLSPLFVCSTLHLRLATTHWWRDEQKETGGRDVFDDLFALFSLPECIFSLSLETFPLSSILSDRGQLEETDLWKVRKEGSRHRNSRRQMCSVFDVPAHWLPISVQDYKLDLLFDYSHSIMMDFCRHSASAPGNY